MTVVASTAAEAAEQIRTLRRNGSLAAAIEVGRDAYGRWPTDIAVLQAISWCLYDRDVKHIDQPDAAQRAAMLRSANLIASWSMTPAATGDYGPYDPTGFIVLSVAERLVRAGAAADAADLLGRIDPGRLSRVGDGKYPSPSMRWYLVMTKALQTLGRWSDLAALHEPWRAVVGHHPQSQWVWYRLSLAHSQCGEHSGALECHDRAFTAQRDPWILGRRARILNDLGRDDEAILAARLALAAARDDEALGYAVAAIELLVERLSDSDPDRARAHLRILVRARHRLGGSTKHFDERAAAQLGVVLEPADDGELAEQRRWWSTAEETQRSRGVVSKVLHHAMAGFITADDGQQHFFAMPPNSTVTAPPEGTRVSFVVVPSFDRRRNRSSTRAIGVCTDSA